MNFSDINSPSQLVQANETNPVAEFVNSLDELSPAEALAVCQMLTLKLHKLHVNMAKRDDTPNRTVWAREAGLLEVAVNILNNIDF